MELSSDQEAVTFRVLQSRLLALVNARIRNGEFSERGLAGLLGISQPQLHNVLKGERKLQTPLADALLARFQISVLDLLSQSEKTYKQEELGAALIGPSGNCLFLHRRPRRK